MTSLLMLSGCAPTQTVCQNDDSKVERVSLPDAWAMTAPEIATEPDTTQPASKPEALRITTENNLKWTKDRNKLIYLQNYILEIRDIVLRNDSHNNK